METIKAVLGRKYNTIKHTYFYSNRKELPRLFSDFQQYIENTKELKDIVETLQKSGHIPKGFFTEDFSITPTSNSPMHDPYTDNFHIIGRIYPAILNEIDMRSLKSGDIPQSHKLQFDEERSRLQINEDEIKIRKFSDQYHTLRVIFETKEGVKQEWFFSEIADKIDEYARKNKDKKYYNAAYQINKKLESAGIKDFFITTRQSLKINPEYLS